MTHDINILPASATAGVTDQDIAVLSRFLVRSTGRTGGLPLQYPRRSLDDNQTSGITHAPLSGKSGFERSRKVLDALVAIAVCGGTQCLALSVSFGATVRITIAQNDETPPSMISRHLERVWIQLRDLAEMQRSIRHENCLPDVLDLHGSSPKAAESHLAVVDPRIQQLKVMKEKLHADIHQHCYMKSKHCITKYLGPCAEFYKFYRQARAVFDPALVLADIVYYLAKIWKTVTGYKGRFDGSGAPVDMDWYDLAKASSLLLQMYLNDTANVTARGNDVMTAWLGRSEVKGESWCLL